MALPEPECEAQQCRIALHTEEYPAGREASVMAPPHEALLELACGAQQCRIALQTEEHPAGGDCLQHTNVTPSTEAEFLSILISSQVALQGNAGTFQQSLPFIQLSEFLPQDTLQCSSALSKAEGDSAQRGVMDDHSTNSLQLFTQSSDDDSPPVLLEHGSPTFFTPKPNLQSHHTSKTTMRNHHTLKTTMRDHHTLKTTLKDHHTLKPTLKDKHAVMPTLQVHQTPRPTLQDHHTLKPTLQVHHTLKPTLQDHQTLNPTLQDHQTLKPTLQDHHTLRPTLQVHNFPKAPHAGGAPIDFHEAALPQVGLTAPRTGPEAPSLKTPVLEDNEDRQLNARCAEKSFAIRSTMRNHFDNIGSSSLKRKKVPTDSSHPSSKNAENSKRPKQSLLKYVGKGFDKQSPGTSCTLLKDCSDKASEYNILAVILQPCHIKEIQTKSGPKSGSVFPLATVVVLDQSDICSKMLMWRAAAFWSLALCPGDIIAVTRLAVCEDTWNGETILQSTLKTCLRNLGNCFTMAIDEYSDAAEYVVLMELISYISTKHSYLRDLPPRQLQKLDGVQHVRLSQLQPDILVHSVLKVTKISLLQECTYRYNGAPQNKIMLTVEEVQGQSHILILWGASVSWCAQIRLKRDHIWQFRYLLGRKNVVSGDVELHTTPWSSCECLFHEDKKAGNFQKQYFGSAPIPRLLSLRTLVEEGYSGVIQIKGSISELEFPVLDMQSVLITRQSSITNILRSLSSVTYSGCGNCQKELKTDGNLVYEQCLLCLPFSRIQTFYRPAIMTVMNEENVIWAHVPSHVVQKIFLNISPNLLSRHVAGSTNITYGAIVADLCRSLLAGKGESYLFTIESRASLDDNSIPLEQEFHILDFHVDI